MLITQNRDIMLHLRKSLTEIDYKNRTAIFEDLDKPGTFIKKHVILNLFNIN
jgi:hypothetical protein